MTRDVLAGQREVHSEVRGLRQLLRGGGGEPQAPAGRAPRYAGQQPPRHLSVRWVA